MINPKPKISDFKFNIHSQFGEDGIIEKIFKIIGTKSKISVEFGACDGFLLSNTANLWTKDWQGILIEMDRKLYKSNLDKVKKYNCIFLNKKVTSDGANTIENILKKENINQVDFLSIDIDSDDYYIFNSLTWLKPRLISCEFNPTIPAHLELLPQKDSFFGCSVLSLVKLAESKGYKLVTTTDTNCFFVREQDISRFSDFDTSLESNFINKRITYLMTGYAGDFVMSRFPTYGFNFPSQQKFINGDVFQIRNYFLLKMKNFIKNILPIRIVEFLNKTSKT